MAIAPRLDKSTFSKCVNVSNKNKAECKLGVYEDETLNVLSVDASTYLTSTEISDGEIRYSGKAVFALTVRKLKNMKQGLSTVINSLILLLEIIVN